MNITKNYVQRVDLYTDFYSPIMDSEIRSSTIVVTQSYERIVIITYLIKDIANIEVNSIIRCVFLNMAENVTRSIIL